jgi:hypothetical protein
VNRKSSEDLKVSQSSSRLVRPDAAEDWQRRPVDNAEAVEWRHWSIA